MFIIIDEFNYDPFIVVDEKTSLTMFFETRKDAEDYAKENLQDGYWQVIESMG
ncbi:MAG: hypothetical protein U9R15_04720 [Chloroflexota bacterium]|nr:hypothetical protein [Chloroflexota bacterium]